MAFLTILVLALIKHLHACFQTAKLHSNLIWIPPRSIVYQLWNCPVLSRHFVWFIEVEWMLSYPFCLKFHSQLWNGCAIGNKVNIHYLGSNFIGHSALQDFFNHLTKMLGKLDANKMFQVFMDEPSINFTFLEKIQEDYLDIE